MMIVGIWRTEKAESSHEGKTGDFHSHELDIIMIIAHTREHHLSLQMMSF